MNMTPILKKNTLKYAGMLAVLSAAAVLQGCSAFHLGNEAVILPAEGEAEAPETVPVSASNAAQKTETAAEWKDLFQAGFSRQNLNLQECDDTFSFGDIPVHAVFEDAEAGIAVSFYDDFTKCGECSNEIEKAVEEAGGDMYAWGLVLPVSVTDEETGGTCVRKVAYVRADGSSRTEFNEAYAEWIAKSLCENEKGAENEN